MRKFLFFAILAVCTFSLSCCGEEPTEKVLSHYPHEFKQVSVWVTPDGEVHKRTGWYYNGIKESEVPYKNGVPEGTFTRWTSHGDIAETGQYEKGEKEGKWTEWYANGKVQSEGEYKEGKRQGKWMGYFYDGGIHWERSYTDDSASGTWKLYHPTGQLAEINNCFPQIAKGSRLLYSPEGKKEKEEHCHYGKLNGIIEEYYPGGALETKASYKDGILNGRTLIYRANRKIWRSLYYTNGVRDSLWIYYDKNGKKIKTSLFQNGNGIAYGESAETTFVNNYIQDTLRYKIEGHDLQYSEIWNKGEKTKLISHYPATLGGKLASEGLYQNGMRNGTWRNWYPNGKLKDSLFYKNDELYGEQLNYDSTGKLYMRKNQFGKNGPTVVRFK